MTANAETPPRHLLLATDLSARCDRAQDRALDLARAWKAKLTIVHALDVVNMTGTPSAPIAAVSIGVVTGPPIGLQKEPLLLVASGQRA